MGIVRYVFGLSIVVTMPPAIVWWFLVHPFVGFWRRIGVRGTLWTVALLMVGAMVGLWFVRPRSWGATWATTGCAWARASGSWSSRGSSR